MGQVGSIDNLDLGDIAKSIQEQEKILQETTFNPLYVYANSIVPAETIRRGYDTYTKADYSNMIKADVPLGGGDSKAESCGHTKVPARKIFTTDGKLHKGEHRYLDCGLTCGGNCDFYPKSIKDIPKGPLHGARVPVGSRLTLKAGTANNDSDPSKFTCYHDSQNSEEIAWNKGSQTGLHEPRLPEGVATGCAGGGNLVKNQFVKTSDSTKIKNDSSRPDFMTDSCYIGNSNLQNKHETLCLESNIDYPAFCQLGDYILTNPTCQNECNFKQGESPSNKKYCDYAYERICKKRIGDPIKRDKDGNIVKATRDYLKDDSRCTRYCEDASSSRCKDIKNSVCTRDVNDWRKENSWIPGYCRQYWQSNIDRNEIDKVCRDDLLEEGGKYNVFSGKGCGMLCMGEGTDVDTDYCKSIKKDFCRKSDANMLTDDCFEFCTTYPDLCDDYLSGTNGMCSRLGITTEEDLEKPVEGTQHKYSDWCGCMMPRQFYNDYANSIADKFQEQGYDVLIKAQTDQSPECMYPQCKQGSIMRKSQQQRKINGLCTDCVQIMLQSLNGSFVDSNIVSEQSANCGNIKQSFLLPGAYKVADIDKYIRVFDDKRYCSYPDRDSLLEDTEIDSNAIRQIDTIPPNNIDVGSCELQPGIYKVRSNNTFIRVHDDDLRSYCVFPEDFQLQNGEFVIIEDIPVRHKLNLEHIQCQDLNVGEPVVSTEEIISIISDSIKTEDMTEEEARNIAIGIIVLIIIIVVVVVGLIIYGFVKLSKK